MSIYEISDKNVKILKQKYLLKILTMLAIASIIAFIIVYFSLKNNNNFLFTSIIFVTIILFFVYFIIKSLLKSFEKTIKSIQYIIENGRLIIRQNDTEQFNSEKENIKYIEHYKNNIIVFVLNSNKKITMNKYLDNYEQLFENIKNMFQVNEMEKNYQNMILNFSAAIFSLIIMGILFFSKYLGLVLLAGIILIIFITIFIVFNKNIDKKQRIIILIGVLIFVIQKIVKLI